MISQDHSPPNSKEEKGGKGRLTFTELDVSHNSERVKKSMKKKKKEKPAKRK